MFDTAKTAVIDIGSNSVRLMMPVAGGGLNHKELLTTVLAENLKKTGVLGIDAIQRTAKAVLDFYAKAKNNGYKNVAVFATAAVRTAKNGNEFVEILAKNNIHVDVIDGKTEAECGFIGATLCFENNHNAVFDIGGASVELAYGKNGKVISALSLPLGVHILRETCSHNKSAVENYVYKKIKQFDILPFDRLIGISGTATSIAAMALKLDKYDPEKVHLAKASLADINMFIDTVFSLDSPKRIMQTFPSLSLNRASVIGYGLIVTKAVLRHLNTEEFIVSETDNTEGYSRLFC